METKAKRLILVMLTALAAIAGFFLRRAGEDTADSFYPTALVVLVCAALAAIGVLLFMLQKRSKHEENFFPGVLWQLPIGLSGVLIAANSLLLLGQVQDSKLTTITCLLGTLGGVLLLALAAMQMLDKRGSFLFLLPLCIWAILQLISDYKKWSSDPVLLDYCFRMLASITGMLSIFHIGGFYFDFGKRRLTIFWCAACTIFSAASLPDCLDRRSELLVIIAMLLLSFSTLVQLVLRGKLLSACTQTE